MENNIEYFENRPITMNEHNNLLQIEEHMYQLQDVEKPNVFRNMFPYDEIPKIPFNDRVVPNNIPKEIWITDTTFRDGQQSRAPYSTEQMVTIYDYLHRLGGPNGMIRQSEFFYIARRIEMPCIGVWSVVISSRRLLRGFGQARKILSL